MKIYEDLAERLLHKKWDLINPEDLGADIEDLRAQIQKKEAALEKRLDVSESYNDWRERIQAAKNSG